MELNLHELCLECLVGSVFVLFCKLLQSFVTIILDWKRGDEVSFAGGISKF